MKRPAELAILRTMLMLVINNLILNLAHLKNQTEAGVRLIFAGDGIKKSIGRYLERDRLALPTS